LKKLLLNFSVLIIGIFQLNAQDQTALQREFDNASNDSLIAETYYTFVTKCFAENPDTMAYFFEEAYQRISEEASSRAFLLERFGDALRKSKSNYQAGKQYKEARELFKEAGSLEDEVRILNRLAGLSKRMDLLEDAQTYSFDGLVIAEQMNDHELMAKFLRSIGVNYTKMQSYENAEKNLRRAIDVSQKHSDTAGIIYGYMSLGNTFKGMGEHSDAQKYYAKSLELAAEKNNQRAMAGNYNNMASSFKMQNRLNEAIAYYQKAIKINTKSGNKVWLSYNYNNLGNVYSSQDRHELALEYQLKALRLKEDLKDVEGLETSYINLAEVYKSLGRYQESVHYYDLYIESTSNSLVEQNLLNLNELSAKYEDEKKLAIIAQMDTLRYLDSLQIVASNESIQKGKSLQRTMWGGLALLLVFCAYLAYSIRAKKKTNRALDEARLNLFEKNKDLTDSINYAKFIQESILSSSHLLRNEFDETLMIYRPKDIVSGDFYWFKPFSDHFVFAMSDCTGHGVPGAFMSLICISAINSVTSSSNVGNPGKALGIIDGIVTETLNGKNIGIDAGKSEISDGMDIALCSINRTTGVLQYAGAHRPLIVIRNGELIRIKGDNISIGGSREQEKVFTDHEVQLQKGDVVYLFTDGYPDQFGGENGKKLKIRPFLNLLIEISSLPMNVQEERLNAHLESWMQGHEQVDDISIIGLRF